jgi:hypothetical protein
VIISAGPWALAEDSADNVRARIATGELRPDHFEISLEFPRAVVPAPKAMSASDRADSAQARLPEMMTLSGAEGAVADARLPTFWAIQSSLRGSAAITNRYTQIGSLCAPESPGSAE